MEPLIYKKLGFPLLTIMFIHQRILVSEIKFFFMDQSYNFQLENSSTTILTYFNSYVQYLFDYTNSALQKLKSPLEIESNFIFHAFFNFLCLLSSLIQFNTIARHIIGLLLMILNEFSKIIEKSKINLTEFSFF